MFSIAYLLRDSGVMIATIFCFVLFSSFVGYLTFRYTFEGFTVFKTPSSSFYNMYILLTTANFPDVMLPAYNANRLSCLFFIFYLIFGLYFIQNLLLATIFNNYKQRIESKIVDKKESRAELIESYFDSFDIEKKGYLDLKEAK